MPVISRCAVCGCFPELKSGYFGKFYACSNPSCGKDSEVDSWNRAQELIRELGIRESISKSDVPSRKEVEESFDRLDEFVDSDRLVWSSDEAAACSTIRARLAWLEKQVEDKNA